MTRANRFFFLFLQSGAMAEHVQSSSAWLAGGFSYSRHVRGLEEARYQVGDLISQ